jgi:RNA polymerase sigma-70 factor (ECF subfamily)
MTAAEQQQRFVELLETHRGIVYKVAGSYSRSAADRDDLVQEICMQLWRAFPRCDAGRRFSTWMYRVALNVAISAARRVRSAEPGRLEPLDEVHLETIAAGEADAGEEGRLEAMHALIGQLEPLDRALILLYLEDQSYADMAEVLGISETNVATKINRIKQRLRGRITADATTGG